MVVDLGVAVEVKAVVSDRQVLEQRCDDLLARPQRARLHNGRWNKNQGLGDDVTQRRKDQLLVLILGVERVL